MKDSLRYLSLALVAISTSTYVNAQIVAVPSLIGGAESPSSADSTYGWKFTVGSSSLSVSQLGLLDLGTSGFSELHKVGIWDSANNLITSAEFASGETGTLNNGFRYLPVSTPATLQAGETYSIGYWSLGTSDTHLTAAVATYSPELTYAGATVAPDPGFSAPFEVHNALNYGTYGANFEFTAVPEPREYALASGLLLLGFGAYRRFRRGDAASVRA